MRPASYFNACPRKQKLLFAMLLPALVILACRTSSLPLPLFPTATPTPTESAGEIQIAVTVVYLADQDESTIRPAQVGTAALTATGSSPVLRTDTPTLEPTATPTDTPISPTQTPQPILTTTITATLTQPAASSGGETAGELTLVAPGSGLSLPANVDGYEFRWRWAEKYICRPPPDDFGFEVRIWPITSTVPLGAMNVTQDKLLISCDSDTGIRSFRVGYLKNTPGVKETGAGKFFWDVAYVQLNPYTPLVTPEPRILEITLDYSGPLDPHGPDLNCADFSSWAEAQAVFLAAGGPEQDPHRLDPDMNGIACDELR